jgi:hypothetical protein
LKSAEIFLTELSARSSLFSAVPASTPVIQPFQVKLPVEALQALSLGWRVFRVDVAGKYASQSIITARIGNATADRAQLELEFSGNPDCNFAAATGLASGIFALEIEFGYAGLAARVGAAIVGGNENSGTDDARTLASRAGNSMFAFFRYPAGRFSRARKQLAPGLTLHGDGGWAWIPPSAHGSGVVHTYLDSDQSVCDAPPWLIDLAFDPSSAGESSSTKRFPPQAAKPAYRSVSVQRSLTARRAIFCPRR